MRRPAVGVRDGVVDIAVDCRSITAGEPARQIPAADKVRQSLRGRVAGFGRHIGRMYQRGQLGRLRQITTSAAGMSASAPIIEPGAGALPSRLATT